jgi:hypothetical protein
MMKEDNSPSFVFFLSCQLLTYSWSAPYDEDSYIRVIRRGDVRSCDGEDDILKARGLLFDSS